MRFIKIYFDALSKTNGSKHKFGKIPNSLIVMILLYLGEDIHKYSQVSKHIWDAYVKYYGGIYAKLARRHLNCHEQLLHKLQCVQFPNWYQCSDAIMKHIDSYIIYDNIASYEKDISIDTSFVNRMIGAIVTNGKINTLDLDVSNNMAEFVKTYKEYENGTNTGFRVSRCFYKIVDFIPCELLMALGVENIRIYLRFKISTPILLNGIKICNEIICKKLLVRNIGLSSNIKCQKWMIAPHTKAILFMKLEQNDFVPILDEIFIDDANINQNKFRDIVKRCTKKLVIGHNITLFDYEDGMRTTFISASFNNRTISKETLSQLGDKTIKNCINGNIISRKHLNISNNFTNLCMLLDVKKSQLSNIIYLANIELSKDVLNNILDNIKYKKIKHLYLKCVKFESDINIMDEINERIDDWKYIETIRVILDSPLPICTVLLQKHNKLKLLQLPSNAIFTTIDIYNSKLIVLNNNGQSFMRQDKGLVL